MSNCAVVNLLDGLVINRIVAEPNDLAPDGTELILCDDIPCDIGWVWNGLEFINPNPPVDNILPEINVDTVQITGDTNGN